MQILGLQLWGMEETKLSEGGWRKLCLGIVTICVTDLCLIFELHCFDINALHNHSHSQIWVNESQNKVSVSHLPFPLKDFSRSKL
jgi:hypothetical protein